MYDFTELKEKLFAGDIAAVESLTRKALDEGAPLKDILEKGLIAGMDVVGKKFKANDIFVPEVLLSAKAMHKGLDILKPFLTGAGIKPIAKIAIGTVKGDLHDIGKNLVSMMLKGAGLEVLDFGIDVTPEKFVNAAKSGTQVIAMSSLLTTSMPSMKKTIDALRAAGVLSSVKTVIGGAPVTQEYAAEIGADGFAPDAASAVDKVKELLGLT